MMVRKLFINAEIFTPVDRGAPAAGRHQGTLRHISRGAIVVENGRIAAIGDGPEVLAGLGRAEVDQEIDCHGRCVIPGFVDPHTHMCFISGRETEFAMRIAGAAYLDILRQGGGILSTVKAVAAASEEELYQATRERVRLALQLGTTTVEIKSGYGLTVADELKMLRVIDRIARSTPQDVVPTFLGAHAVPPSYRDRPDDFITLVIDEMLPAVIKQGVARHCDIFCEKGVFSIEQSRRLLKAAQALGFGIKLHADEVHDLGGAALAAELQALSADHLLAADIDNIRAMARAGVVAILLPATAYSLQKSYAPARQMIDCGVGVALATDCNPGSSFTESMPFVIGLAVLQMAMSPAEALTAATLNAAYGLGMANRVGSLEVGKQADLLLLEGESPAIFAFHAGVSPVVGVYKRGERVDWAYAKRGREKW